MRNLFRTGRFLILLPLVAVVTALLAAEALPDPAVVAEAEKRFARTGWERGIRSSFLEFFADDSIVFSPEPKNGKTFYTNYTDKGRALFWEPVFAAISKSGELGVTTGPWHLKKSKTDEHAIAYGEFASIWKKQSDLSWKVALDVGVEHGERTGPKPELQLSAPSAAASNEARLADQEGRFEHTLRLDDAGTALTESADENIHVLRDDSLPAVGKDAAKKILLGNRVTITRTVAGSGISQSSDLAYRYGAFSSSGGDKGYYLTVWKTDPSGAWKIILDLQKKTPPSDQK
jgi:ketosteroid isomerase-like protein